MKDLRCVISMFTPIWIEKNLLMRYLSQKQLQISHFSVLLPLTFPSYSLKKLSRETVVWNAKISDYFFILPRLSLLFLSSFWLRMLCSASPKGLCCLSVELLPTLPSSPPYHQTDSLLFSHCAAWFTMFFFLPPLVPFLCLSHLLHNTTPRYLQLVGLCNLSFHWLTSCVQLNFCTWFCAFGHCVREHVDTPN